MPLEQLIPLLDGAGTVGVLTVALVAWLRGWVVSRREFEAMREDRDRWLSITLRAANLAEKSTQTADRATTVLEDRI